MKIKINNHEIEIKVHAKSSCGAGNYWVTAYQLDGITLAECHTGPTKVSPSPLDLLNAEREYCVEDYKNPDAEEHQGISWDGSIVSWKNSDVNATRFTCGNRKGAGLKIKYTIREKIEWALKQIVIE